MSHGHYIEFARGCGHIVAQCRCPAGMMERAVRYRAGLCAECATKMARETTRQKFPQSFSQAPTVELQGDIKAILEVSVDPPDTTPNGFDGFGGGGGFSGGGAGGDF